MLDLSQYRVIDLSPEIVPGERRIDGHYLHGEPWYGRPVEVQEFIAYGARMHFIQGQTHTSSHAEAPYKYSDTGADVGSLPADAYMGEAVACNFTLKKAGEAITPADFQQAGVRAGDIVLAWGSAETTENPPYLTFAAIDWLVGTRIKLYGPENLRFSPPGTPFGKSDGDARLLLGGVLLVDGLTGLDRIRKPRVFFMGVPMKLRRVTAVPVRAVALEEK